MNQKLEDDLKAVQIEADKLKVERASLMQRLKILEHESRRGRSVDEVRPSDTNLNALQIELEELRVRNGVYMEKINELVDQINQLDEENAIMSEERLRQIQLLKKQNEELTAKLPENERANAMKNLAQINTDQTAKRKNLNLAVTPKIVGGDQDTQVLKQENESLKQQLLILKNKNMDLLNQLTEFKTRSRSRSDNRRR